MVRHSKNNTASGVFTYAERQMVDYGTKSKRLGSDTKRPFDSCYLCLNTARTPMICTSGHISCKECVMTSILEQKRAIERAKHEFADYQKQEAAELAAKQKDRDENEVKRFIEREVGLSRVGSSSRRRQTEDETAGESALAAKKPKLIQYEAGSSKSKSRAVFALGKGKEADSVDAVTESEEKGKSKLLPSFWIPSLAPEAKLTVADPSTRSVQCQASSPSHPLKLKHLVEVRFRTSASSKGEKLCPSCDKALLNSSKIDVMARCGHAVCHRCVSNFVLATGACVVCQERIADKSDMIRIDSEGTGFTGGGGKMVATRYDSALQA
ncbi:hypothetical protein H4R26_001943 [Coemansia thaxteri]|uniref:RING-type domain-containing protein n=1 Tax=Coemansia thaxteri TaxID=2663907 RepID=A0A9W8BHI5_9FUNG|nr:hypothetical protein H4R26_001943 [Coemansia thaxteri]